MFKKAKQPAKPESVLNILHDKYKSYYNYRQRSNVDAFGADDIAKLRDIDLKCGFPSNVLSDKLIALGQEWFFDGTMYEIQQTIVLFQQAADIELAMQEYIKNKSFRSYTYIAQAAHIRDDTDITCEFFDGIRTDDETAAGLPDLEIRYLVYLSLLGKSNGIDIVSEIIKANTTIGLNTDN
jgi:hypothetical protein